MSGGGAGAVVSGSGPFVELWRRIGRQQQFDYGFSIAGERGGLPRYAASTDTNTRPDYRSDTETDAHADLHSHNGDKCSDGKPR
jgi:hypothetical protein